MKVLRKDKVKMYLFIRQDGGQPLELGLVSLVDAMRRAQKMAKGYLYADLRAKETEVKVYARTILYEQPQEITTISAWRSGRSITVIHQ